MLINGVAYRQGTRLVDLPIEEISDHLDKPDCFVWVALRDPSALERDTMRVEFDLHPLAVEDTSHSDQRPKVVVLKHAVSPLLQFAGKLHGGRVPTVCEKTQAYFRDVSDHVARIDAAIDSIRETIATAITVNLSMAAIEESEVTKRLAAWAAISAVATAFAGIWGMNFEPMPELKFKWGYPAALALIVITCGFVWWRFRRARWP